MEDNVAREIILQNTERIICKGISVYKPRVVSVAIHEIRKMVFCYQNCSDLLWGKIVLVVEKNF